jgi:drug/metabolite transporter (DMT)-like permease
MLLWMKFFNQETKQMPNNILKGIVYALAACFLWGLISVVPLYMKGFTPVEITFGRFLIYGTVSCLFFLKIYCQGRGRYPFPMWWKALVFSLGCILCDYFFVLSLRYSNPAISTLIIGVSPITIAFYGNWKQKECSSKSLIFPSILILTGLVVINAPVIMHSTSPDRILLGLLFAILSLATWSWFVVANSAFLKVNSKVNSTDWATLIGIFTLLWVLILAVVHSICDEGFYCNKYSIPNQQLAVFILGSILLGIFCSWLGYFFWNKASLNLPVSLLGLMMIFSTLFGLAFVYLYEQHLPAKLEMLGIALLLAAIVYGLRVSSKTFETQSNP